MGFLDRFRDRGASAPSGPVEPVAIPDSGPAAELADWLRELAGPGFRDRGDVVEAAVQAVEDDPDGYPGLGSDDAVRVAAAVWAQLLGRQAGWSDEGDYARLAAAFDELAAAGVVARMDFTCCQTCGHTEIGDERGDGAAWAYTFFHQQDSERLAPGGSDLYLAFGTFGLPDDIDPDLVARARAGDAEARREAAALGDVRAAGLVTETLRRHGLTVAWDGTAEQRIRVTDLDWRKRLPA